MLTLDMWVTSSGKYPERASSKELTDEVKANANRLIETINNFLSELDWKESIVVSSGFRPNSVNSTIKNAAKKSLHLTGLAVDIVDQDGKFALLLSTDKGQELLKKYSLWQEHPDKTPTWEHLDLGDRAIKVRPLCRDRQFFP